MLEDFLSKAIKRKAYSLILGVLYVLISYGTAKLFFPNDISTIMIMFITLLFVPTISKLISIEEKMERKDGVHHFLRDHKTLMEIFLFLFIGISIGYLITGNIAPDSLSHQNKILEQQGAVVSKETIVKTQEIQRFVGISTNNVEVILIAFVLSLFFGAGALFLIVRTASVFASFILNLSQNTMLSATVFAIHFVPEILGFLLAALAGGVISKAFMREKLGSVNFRNVIKDGTILVLLSFLFILIAAALEVFVTPALFISLL